MIELVQGVDDSGVVVGLVPPGQPPDRPEQAGGPALVSGGLIQVVAEVGVGDERVGEVGLVGLLTLVEGEWLASDVAVLGPSTITPIDQDAAGDPGAPTPEEG